LPQRWRLHPENGSPPCIDRREKTVVLNVRGTRKIRHDVKASTNAPILAKCFCLPAMALPNAEARRTTNYTPRALVTIPCSMGYLRVRIPCFDWASTLN
jgi:hypothetical protein